MSLHVLCEELTQLIRSDGVGVLVNLDGWTSGAKNEVFALRPAPVQVAALGFAGSMGARFMDYMLTDALATPPDAAAAYDERFVVLPDSYILNSHQLRFQSLPWDNAGKLRERYELGSEDDVLFCNFNHLFKITPDVFARWMAVLHRVPNSKLWFIR